MKLLDTAAELFYNGGYSATTTRQISERLGIQKASLYHHVDSKEDLLYQICLSSLERLVSGVELAVAEADTAEARIRAAVRAHLDGALGNVKAHTVMLRDMNALSGDRRAAIAGRRSAYENSLRTLVDAGRSAGALRSDLPSRQLTLALLNLINWPIVWFRGDGDMTPAEIADFLLDIFLNGARFRLP